MIHALEEPSSGSIDVQMWVTLFFKLIYKVTCINFAERTGGFLSISQEIQKKPLISCIWSSNNHVLPGGIVA